MFNSSLKFQGLKSKRKENIRQLFRATDFESLMYPCFTFCRIVGIFPYEIKASIIKINKLNNILSTIVMCIFCVSEIINFYEINYIDDLTYKHAGIPRVLERNCFYIFGGLIAVIVSSLVGPRMHLLQTIMEVSSKLSPESYQNLSRLIHAKDIFGFVFIIIEMLLVYFIMPFEPHRKLLTAYIFVLLFQTDMLYMNCVCILKACFKQINDNLINLRELITNDELHLLSGTYHEQRKSFLEIKITILKKQHMAVSDTVEMLNTVFSVQLLASIIMTFIELTFNLYFCLAQVHSTVSMNAIQKQFYYEFTFTAVTYYFTKIMLVIWACETSKIQIMKINSTVHHMTNNINNKRIKYEVDLQN